MSQDLINRYKQSIWLKLPNKISEQNYRDTLPSRGRSSSVFAFLVLAFINGAFAYLEFRAFGHDVPYPMYGYLLLCVVALANFLSSQFSKALHWVGIRLVANGVLTMVVVLSAIYWQQYSAYHALEMSILLVWLGSLNSIRFIWGIAVNIVMSIAFMGVMSLDPELSRFWISLVAVPLGIATLLATYLSYLFARQRRMLYLRHSINVSITNRQELWAFTLIDIDMALSGIHNFKELIELLQKHLESVIEFDSYILTSLEGQGPRLQPNKVQGGLFEQEDNTLWSDDLINKLVQTRQATISAEHETVRGMLGFKQMRFTSYRLDVPVFSDSKLMGIISMRRDTEPFDDLDMIASASIATQAMLIFKRTVNNSSLVITPSMPEPIVPRSATRPVEVEITEATASEKLSSTQSTDMDVTDFSAQEVDEMVAPTDLVQKIKNDEEKAKKTITLLSRDNADRIAIDRYRTAAVEGESLSILIIEVDGLSKLREQDGDQVAYKVFAAIVKYIFSKIDRNKDILGRYGQNGLSVLMPRIDMNAGERFAETIREYVERTKYKTAYGEKSATLSIGVAAITNDTGDYNSMIKRADMALFVAKKNGRNCVKVRL
ncbi:MAG: diguanylate cyclase (GGDEF)-like protein [Gammaproteobacteria bacterium]